MIITFGILAAALVLFIWGRWRYDVVAFVCLMVGVLAGVVPFEDAYSGLGHPAVITVAAALVLSRGLQSSGLIDRLARGLTVFNQRPLLMMGALTVLAAVLSAFMNNVAALALLMPLALQSGLPPAQILMPLSFGSILGGLTTLIGTPPNIIIASYRADAAGSPFGLFDFSPVGVPLAILGVLLHHVSRMEVHTEGASRPEATPGSVRDCELCRRSESAQGIPIGGEGGGGAGENGRGRSHRRFLDPPKKASTGDAETRDAGRGRHFVGGSGPS